MQFRSSVQMILMQRSIDAFVKPQLQDQLLDHYPPWCVLLLH